MIVSIISLAGFDGLGKRGDTRSSSPLAAASCRSSSWPSRRRSPSSPSGGTTRALNERWYRLDRFARANGMTFAPGVPAPGLPGMIFGIGSARAASDLVRGDRPRFVEFANYAVHDRLGQEPHHAPWGYVAIKLDVPLPNIVLDATSNNALFGSNLPATFDRDQRLSLEGDFDEHFSLYCPAGYEQRRAVPLHSRHHGALHRPRRRARRRDRRRLAVPLRQARVLEPGPGDVGVAVLGRRRTARQVRPVGALARREAAGGCRRRGIRDVQARRRRGRPCDGGAASALSTALPFAAPTQALRPPPGVAFTGRRLKRGVPWGAVIVFGFFAAFWLAGQFGLVDLFFGMFSP